MKGSSWPFAPSGITARPIRPESGLSDDDDDDFLPLLPFFPLWIYSLSPPLFSLSLFKLGGHGSKNTRHCPRRRWKKLFIGIIPREIELEKLRLVTHSCDPLYYAPYCATVKGGEGWKKKKKKKEGKISSSFVGGSSVTHDRQQRNHSWRRAPRPFFRFARDRLLSLSLSLFAFIETCDSLLCRLCEIIGGRERLRLRFQGASFGYSCLFFSRYSILGNVRLTKDALISRYIQLSTYDWK